MLDVIKKIFGSKYDRDVKEYSPIVDKINEHFASYHDISHDELRNKTLDFRSRIADHLSAVIKQTWMANKLWSMCGITLVIFVSVCIPLLQH